MTSDELSQRLVAARIGKVVDALPDTDGSHVRTCSLRYVARA